MLGPPIMQATGAMPPGHCVDGGESLHTVLLEFARGPSWKRAAGSCLGLMRLFYIVKIFGKF